jgi:hypothetical protein
MAGFFSFRRSERYANASFPSLHGNYQPYSDSGAIKLYSPFDQADGGPALLRIAFLIGAIFLAWDNVQAQDCVPGLINLSSQADVDGFQSTYGPCNRVTVELAISGFDITSLQPLAPLASVNGYLAIESAPSLPGLQGLESLSSVQALLLWGLHGLSDLTGLGSLDSVSIIFHIQNTNGMVNLSGLPATMSELHTLFLEGNDSLVSLAGFPSVTSGMSLIAVVGNNALTSLAGMPASIPSLETLSIVFNEKLETLDGLSAIPSLEGDLGVSANPALTSLTALSGVSFAVQDPADPRQGITIGGNPLLGSLEGVPTNTQLNDLEITDNTGLTTLAPLAPRTSPTWRTCSSATTGQAAAASRKFSKGRPTP